MNVSVSNPWLVAPKPNPGASVRLFCLPFAGGGASTYRDWPDSLSKDIDLIAIQPPGREERYSEPCFDRLEQMVDACLTAMLPVLDRPCVLFGHSMGARIAYELAKRLPQYRSQPMGLIVSGARAPHFPKTDPVYHLQDDLLIEEIRKKNGTPEEILQDRELMQVLLPRLRADYTLADTAPLESGGPKLNHPIVALGGLLDVDVPLEKLAGWRDYAAGDFSMHLFEGDHFFIRSSRRLVLPFVDYVLDSIVESARSTRTVDGSTRRGVA